MLMINNETREILKKKFNKELANKSLNYVDASYNIPRSITIDHHLETILNVYPSKPEVVFSCKNQNERSQMEVFTIDVKLLDRFFNEDIHLQPVYKSVIRGGKKLYGFFLEEISIGELFLNTL